MTRSSVLLAFAAAIAACRPDARGGSALPGESAMPLVERGDEPPVALNAVSPVGYPAALARERIDGVVLLRLFADSTGRLVPDSTRVAESSGYPALDSAALAGAAQLRFAPALRRGTPVATAFLQPVHFRHPPGSP
ncbi:MAG TPA: energy transducer TonB [Gemmatimonadales bacterium]|nr:energy transducer TonB [Gemmatimonadales bacterium]